MTYNDVMSAVSCVLTVVGTILSVLCVLKMSVKDVMYTRTCEGHDNAQFTVLEQRYYARRGIGVIIIGAILQIISILWSCENAYMFGACMLTAVILIVILFLEEGVRYKRDKERCTVK